MNSGEGGISSNQTSNLEGQAERESLGEAVAEAVGGGGRGKRGVSSNGRAAGKRQKRQVKLQVAVVLLLSLLSVPWSSSAFGVSRRNLLGDQLGTEGKGNRPVRCCMLLNKGGLG